MIVWLWLIYDSMTVVSFIILTLSSKIYRKNKRKLKKEKRKKNEKENENR